jgi:CubicO group peptidase (beta-lactamase class C family)
MKALFFLSALIVFYGTSAQTPTVAPNDTCRKIDAYLTQLSQEKNFSGGLLILKNGKKIFSKGYGWANRQTQTPFTPETLASMGSITKAFTASAILTLVEQGKLSLDDPLRKFFPTAPADKSGITIHQLLTHSAGFREFLTGDAGDYEKVETRKFLTRALKELLAFAPGSKAIYTNVGYSLLGIIIEQVSGQDYEQYLQKVLLVPMGIQEIGYHYPPSHPERIAVGYQMGKAWGTHQDKFAAAEGGPFWNLKANGGLEASLNDMEKWIIGIGNHTVLSPAMTDKMFSPLVKEEGYDGRSYFGYGCNISQSRRNTKMIDNGGSNNIYFARLIRLPEEGVVFYMVTNESSVGTDKVLPNVTQLYFLGAIQQDAMTMGPRFEHPLSEKIYNLLSNNPVQSLEEEMKKQGLHVEDDMILLDVGHNLIREGKAEKARVLYEFYTRSFPNIVVAWNDLGDVYRSLNREAEAKRCYQQALVLRPNNPRAKAALGIRD